MAKINLLGRLNGWARMFPTGSGPQAPPEIDNAAPIQPVADAARQAAYNAMQGDPQLSRFDGWAQQHNQVSLAGAGGSGTNISPFSNGTNPPPEFVRQDPDAWVYWIYSATVKITATTSSIADIGGATISVQPALSFGISGTSREIPIFHGTRSSGNGVQEFVFETATTGWLVNLINPALPFPLFNPEAIQLDVFNNAGAVGTVQYSMGILGKWWPKGYPVR